PAQLVLSSPRQRPSNSSPTRTQGEQASSHKASFVFLPRSKKTRHGPERIASIFLPPLARLSTTRLRLLGDFRVLSLASQYQPYLPFGPLLLTNPGSAMQRTGSANL